MLFNSLTFALFLPTVFCLYWLLNRRLRWQNLFTVIASYVFYGCWDSRFLLLIAFTSLCSWGSGLLIEKSSRPKIWLTLNIVINLLILGVFKYFNFFVGSFCELFGLSHSVTLNVILPVGISFYTFQALSYSIDVYRKQMAPTRDAVAFFAYVSFFPQLVAGPIERASNLLPQFERSRSFDCDAAVDGMRRILWGLFKKIAVADTCARIVDPIFSNCSQQSGSTLALAALLFAFQIYGDFSGYSDIAVGTAKLFGIRLRENFLMPYFSRNMAEFWKRWHISLNTWFVQYVYIPLGGSREGRWKTIRNTLVIFLLSGLWHGADWTFVAWGLYHALLFVPLILLGRTKKYRNTASWKQLPQILLTFLLTTFGWILFRAADISETGRFICGMFTSPWTNPFQIDDRMPLICIGIMTVTEWLQRHKQHALDLSGLHSHLLKWSIYIALICLLFLSYQGSESFIYFQF